MSTELIHVAKVWAVVISWSTRDIEKYAPSFKDGMQHKKTMKPWLFLKQVRVFHFDMSYKTANICV